MLGRPDAALNDKIVGPDCSDTVSGVNTRPMAKTTNDANKNLGAVGELRLYTGQSGERGIASSR